MEPFFYQEQSRKRKAKKEEEEREFNDGLGALVCDFQAQAVVFFCYCLFLYFLPLGTLAQRD